MKTIMENRDTGQIKAMKIGFSWTLLLFACFFGLPLFLRRLYGWGVVFLAILAVNFFVPSMINVPADRAVVQVFISLIALCMVLFIAIKGNEITAKHYLENGWTFVE